MKDPKELYKALAADFKTEKNYYFASRGEGMRQGWENGTQRVFLINTKTEEALELLDAHGNFSLWDSSAVDMAAAQKYPEEARNNALSLSAPYHFGINEFGGGVAYVSWTLQPDGSYYMDEDGFGMENDYEVTIYAFIDTTGRILIPFQPMEGTLRSTLRKQAVAIAKGNMPK